MRDIYIAQVCNKNLWRRYAAETFAGHFQTGHANSLATQILGQWIPDCWTGRSESTRTKRASMNTRYNQSIDNGRSQRRATGNGGDHKGTVYFFTWLACWEPLGAYISRLRLRASNNYLKMVGRGRRSLWLLLQQLGQILLVVNQAGSSPADKIIRIGYLASYMQNAGAINVAIERAQNDGLLPGFNFRYAFG